MNGEYNKGYGIPSTHQIVIFVKYSTCIFKTCKIIILAVLQLCMFVKIIKVSLDKNLIRFKYNET